MGKKIKHTCIACGEPATELVRVCSTHQEWSEDYQGWVTQREFGETKYQCPNRRCEHESTDYEEWLTENLS